MHCAWQRERCGTEQKRYDAEGAAPERARGARAQASGNVAGLCNWAAAMCTYHDVAKVVEPKTVALRGAEAKLKVAMREKGAALDELAVVQGRLDEMQARRPASWE